MIKAYNGLLVFPMNLGNIFITAVHFRVCITSRVMLHSEKTSPIVITLTWIVYNQDKKLFTKKEKLSKMDKQRTCDLVQSDVVQREREREREREDDNDDKDDKRMIKLTKKILPQY